MPSSSRTLAAVFFVLACIARVGAAEPPQSFDIVVVGGTPGGIMAAVAAAREGRSALILERSGHIGGLPANGLGATDIATRGATGGLFLEFVERVHRHYVETYGLQSSQVQDSSGGYHFEPHVAEQVFQRLMAEEGPRITVRLERQFDAKPQNVVLLRQRLSEIRVTHRKTRAEERYSGRVFIDATYEGDLAAAAGVPFRLGREAASEFHEPMAGKLYKPWGGPVDPGSTGDGDQAVQAYNYRLCLTQRQENMVAIPMPEGYDRTEYVSLIDDVRLGRVAAPAGAPRKEMAFDGIGRMVNMVVLPQGKTDANNQHAAFLSTDLPEENWPWPTADWEWRDRYAQRLRRYTLGLLWFAQHDASLPEDFRRRCLMWGLAKDEYTDNGHFPRQVYVREGRRIEGEHLFTAHDALPTAKGSRPPVYAASITASHYALDSHAVRKREPDRGHLDGFFSYPTRPYTVPYGVILPKRVEGLLCPVPVSGTHIGFSTLRMEPCWMALGQAAGQAAAIAIQDGVTPRAVPMWKLQRRLLDRGAVLIYFRDARPGDAHFASLQFFAIRAFYPPSEWQAKLNVPVSPEWAEKWTTWSGVKLPSGYVPGKTTRGQLLDALYQRVLELPGERTTAIHGHW